MLSRVYKKQDNALVPHMPDQFPVKTCKIATILQVYQTVAEASYSLKASRIYR